MFKKNFSFLLLPMVMFFTLSCSPTNSFDNFDFDFEDMKDVSSGGNGKTDSHSACKKDHPQYATCRYQESKSATPVQDIPIFQYTCTSSDSHQPKVNIVLHEYTYSQGPKPPNALVCELLENNRFVLFAHKMTNYCRTHKEKSLEKRLAHYRSLNYVCNQVYAHGTPLSEVTTPPSSHCHPPMIGPDCAPYTPPTTPSPSQPSPSTPTQNPLPTNPPPSSTAPPRSRIHIPNAPSWSA